MRAYVITDTAVTADVLENDKSTIGVTSSKKTAIDACEEFLGRIGEMGIIKWQSKDKHTGCAVLGDHAVSYKMFFVNQIEE